MHLAVTHELGLLQPGDHAENALLFRVGQVGLEADQIVQAAGQVVLAQLDHGERPPAGARVLQAHGAHGAVGQRHFTPAGYHLHRQAALEILVPAGPHTLIELLLEGAQLDAFGAGQGFAEAVVFFLGEGAVDVILVRLEAFGVAGSPEGNLHVDRFGRNDRRDGVEEGKVLHPGQLLQGCGQRG